MAVLRSEGAGSVIEILVESGNRVSDGDEIIVMESMKMEMPVVASEDGIVTEVHVSVGGTVQEDDAIVTIAKDSAA